MILFEYDGAVVGFEVFPDATDFLEGYAGWPIGHIRIGDDTTNRIQAVFNGEGWEVLEGISAPVGVVDTANNGSWFHADRFWVNDLHQGDGGKGCIVFWPSPASLQPPWSFISRLVTSIEVSWCMFYPTHRRQTVKRTTRSGCWLRPVLWRGSIPAFLTGPVRIISPPWHRPLGWHPSACGRRNSECSTIITNNILLYFMQVKLISDQLRNIKGMNEYNIYAIV